MFVKKIINKYIDNISNIIIITKIIATNSVPLINNLRVIRSWFLISSHKRLKHNIS